jgi:hypothetical protein
MIPLGLLIITNLAVYGTKPTKCLIPCFETNFLSINVFYGTQVKELAKFKSI